MSLPPLDRRAVALLSGGLDSLLAARLLVLQGIELTAITFSTDFGCGTGTGGGCGTDTRGLELGFDIKFCHLGESYISLVRRPRYGYGKHHNPCLDCRGMMLAEAWEYARAIGASWLATGEVLAQRPMSQRRLAMCEVDKRLGLAGRILRPLSARLLEPTEMEREGIVDRDRLHRMHGRNRKPQMALAQELGIAEYPTPSGGCLLTDARYAARVRDLFHFAPADRDPHAVEVRALRWGRNFRLGPRTKFVVGRNELDNAQLAGLARPVDTLIEPLLDGPSALILGEVDEDARRFVAEAAASYTRWEPGTAVDFDVDRERRLTVARPADRSAFQHLLI